MTTIETLRKAVEAAIEAVQHNPSPENHEKLYQARNALYQERNALQCLARQALKRERKQ